MTLNLNLSLMISHALVVPLTGGSLLKHAPDVLLHIHGNPRKPASEWRMIKHFPRIVLSFEIFYLVSNHSSLVSISLHISPMVMDFPPPAFTSIS